ncbi:hypothetical protein GQ53DRAFT_745096 [Thozetella sp. PMI_491]|nr:hypothetical protein GQ53DRAFT_745096 [Thozetella sp. PMI_491]
MEKKASNMAPVATNTTNTVGETEEIVANGKEMGIEATADEALDFLGCHPDDFVYSSQEARRVRWKLDLILLPLVNLSSPRSDKMAP